MCLGLIVLKPDVWCILPIDSYFTIDEIQYCINFYMQIYF